jgi:hypothetical protein
MNIFKLSAFHGTDYTTHTVFYATSLEEATQLVNEFTDWLIANRDKEYDYDDNDENAYEKRCVVEAFSSSLYCREYEFQLSKYQPHQREYVFTSLMGMLKDVEANSLLFNESQIDGD